MLIKLTKLNLIIHHTGVAVSDWTLFLTTSCVCFAAITTTMTDLNGALFGVRLTSA